MNLTKTLRAVVVDRFKEGIPISEIALWYRVPAVKIEAVIREAMNVADIEVSLLRKTERPNQ